MIGELKITAKNIEDRLSATWTLDTRDLIRPPVEEILRDLISQAPKGEIERLKIEFFAEGPIATLMSDVDISEIVINGSQEIWYEKRGSWFRHSDEFLTPSTFKNFVDRLCADAGLQLDLSRPFADGRFHDFRVHVTMAPLSHCPFHVTFRRMSGKPWTLTGLLEAGWAHTQGVNTIRTWLETRKNFLFIGPTGSGKTSVLGACLKELPDNERVVILEDTSELPRPNSASTKLLTRAAVPPTLCEVTLGDLVKQSLRMRPSRLVVGEVRGGEAKDLLMALATGHTGSLGTLHASDPRQALLRLEMLVQLGAPQWSVNAIRKLIHLSVDGIIVCGNENGHRRLAGVHKVAALESFGFILEQLC